ncbi:MAG: ATP-dependent DNA helicase RecG [Burkholderiales bacterium]|nr:ATP-dependent DNA helicase RecG [Burkholderiales bacterium]
MTDLGKFARLGIRTEADLLLHLPLRYEDETRIVAIADVAPGETAQVAGEVRSNEIVTRPRRMLQVELDDGSGRIGLRFLNFYGSQVAQLAVGRRLRAMGEVRGGLFGLEMVHPRYRMLGGADRLPATLTPVYPTVAGIGQSDLRRTILEALARTDWADTLRPGCAERLGLPALMPSLRLLHQPPPETPLSAIEDRTHPACRRLAFEELLAQQLSLKRARAARAGQRAVPLPDHAQTQRLLAALPFALTGAQTRAWHEISRDLAGSEPMNRLLQGDVGSGKTVVAALAAMQAIGSGRQAALMAPTEILAEQHFRKLGPWLEPLGVRVAWLSGSLTASAKKKVRALAAAGEVDLLVGTHALVEESVELPTLGLAIVDEQHRFGVAQRLALRATRGDALPHQLMMSATPIPRTLAMSYYADLDVSVIDELPPGRTPVITKLVTQSRHAEVVERVRAAVAQGRQVYWVCPLIEESETLDLQTAIDAFESLSAELADLRVGLIHGRLPVAEKAATMDAFVRGEIDLLVATTVIEVGVDVPNASLMVIEHAERFGLSQLHQLRGRVGRGSAQSVCVLLYRPPLSANARERLKTMYETTDGFEVARRDLLLRGPGEFLGARQSGLALLRFADLERDADLVDEARIEADAMLAGPPRRVDAHLARWLAGREEFLKA